MRLDKMTSRLQNALSDAQSLALGKDHSAVEAVHLLPCWSRAARLRCCRC
jgi:ATP-dependent Clp protease ATP-binding subunit ClpB